MGDRVTAGQRERGTTLTCAQCGHPFSPRNRNGIPARFCSRRCLDRYRNAVRLQSAAALKEQSAPAPAGPSRHAQRVSRAVFQAVVPVAEREACVRQACANLGITDPAVIARALRRNGCAPTCEVAS